MFRFLVRLWNWVKSWFKPNESPVVTAPKAAAPKQNYEYFLNKGISFGQSRNLEEALVSFEQALKIKPDCYLAWYNRGILLNELGKKEEALASYDQSLKIKSNYFAWINRGILLNELGRKEEALASYDQALKIKSDHYYIAWDNRGNVLSDLGKKEEALASHEQALKIKPDYYSAWDNRGIVLSDLGRKEEALASHEQALKIKPDYYRAWTNRGVVLSDLARKEESLASYDQALKLKPNHYQAWTNRGIILSNLGRQEEALASHEQALKIKPNYYRAWETIGISLSNLEKNEAALVCFDQALKLKPDNSKQWMNRGIVLSDLGRKEESLASYDRALKIKQDLYEAWYNRSVVLSKLRRNEEALASCDQALKIKPDYYQAWCNRGASLNNLGRFEEALLSISQAFKLCPDYYHAWYVFGYALEQLKRQEEAVASYDQALKLKPDDYGTWSARGTALSELEEKEKAIASYDQALKLKPDYYEVWHNRGLVVYQSHNYNPFIQLEFVNLFCSEASQLAKRKILRFEELDASKVLDYLKASLNNSQEILIQTFDYDNSGKLIEQINYDFLEALHKLIQQPIPRKVIDLIQKPVSAKVVDQLEQDLFFHPYRFNPQLNLRGYAGKIASLEAELNKAIKKDTHSLEWGILNYEIGQAHYFEGYLNSHSFDYWHKAVASYDRALETLTEEDYPEEHLEVLQGLIKVQLGFGNTEVANQLRLKGLEVLKNLLNKTPSFAVKKKLQLKFIAFRRLNVDILIKQGQLIEALTSAELSKNICLNNLLHTWQEQTVCPSYEQIQELLTPERAIVYWHLSPQSLHTFILKANLSEPIIIQQSLEQQQDITQLPQSLQRLQKYKTWLKQWNEQYQDYRGKDKKVAEQDHRHHIWRTKMFSRLEKLKTILDIDTIESQLLGITQLILIPHQDLHRLPLHLLFDSFLANSESTINYFPSLQIALTLQQKPTTNNQLSLLNVENPANDLPYAEIESVLINSMFTNPNYIDTATNSLLKTELQKPHNILHFTGHGAYNQHQPQNSFLTLTGKEQITAQEISQLNLRNYQLISLAACETAITGKETIDTEYVGLVSGFLEAGATSVLSTLWTVEEISSAWLMIRFYQLYLEPKPPALALKEAQQWLQTVTYPELKIWLEHLVIGIRETHPNVYAYLQDVIRDIEQKSDKIDVDYRPYKDLYYWAAYTFTGGKLS
ncbi:MAG: tetratricopeptide repeat protein [Xenococcus sp. (in: cyanobacteria)]